VGGVPRTGDSLELGEAYHVAVRKPNIEKRKKHWVGGDVTEEWRHSSKENVEGKMTGELGQ